MLHTKREKLDGNLVLYMIPIFTTLIWIHIRQHGTEGNSFFFLRHPRAIRKVILGNGFHQHLDGTRDIIGRGLKGKAGLFGAGHKVTIMRRLCARAG